MAGLTVEARGKNQVMEMAKYHFDNNDSVFFSLWCGKELRFPFTKQDEEDAMNTLAQNLTMLEMSQTMAIYTLRFHSDLDKNGRISSNTPYISSFNFKMADQQGYAQGGGLQPFQSVPNAQLLETVNALRAEIAEIKSGAVGSAETSKEDFILGIMENPLTQFIAGVVVDKMFPGKNYSNNMRQQSNETYQRPVQGIAGDNETIDIGDQENKCQQAVIRLFKVDPKIGDHLLQLAALAEKSPAKYNMALKFL